MGADAHTAQLHAAQIAASSFGSLFAGGQIPGTPTAGSFYGLATPKLPMWKSKTMPAPVYARVFGGGESHQVQAMRLLVQFSIDQSKKNRSSATVKFADQPNTADSSHSNSTTMTSNGPPKPVNATSFPFSPMTATVARPGSASSKASSLLDGGMGTTRSDHTLATGGGTHDPRAKAILRQQTEAAEAFDKVFTKESLVRHKFLNESSINRVPTLDQPLFTLRPDLAPKEKEGSNINHANPVGKKKEVGELVLKPSPIVAIMNRASSLRKSASTGILSGLPAEGDTATSLLVSPTRGKRITGLDRIRMASMAHKDDKTGVSRHRDPALDVAYTKRVVSVNVVDTETASEGPSVHPGHSKPPVLIGHGDSQVMPHKHQHRRTSEVRRLPGAGPLELTSSTFSVLPLKVDEATANAAQIVSVSPTKAPAPGRRDLTVGARTGAHLDPEVQSVYFDGGYTVPFSGLPARSAYDDLSPAELQQQPCDIAPPILATELIGASATAIDTSMSPGPPYGLMAPSHIPEWLWTRASFQQVYQLPLAEYCMDTLQKPHEQRSRVELIKLAEWLTHVKWLCTLPEGVRAPLTRFGYGRKVAAGEVIYTRNSLATCMYILVEGHAAMSSAATTHGLVRHREGGREGGDCHVVMLCWWLERIVVWGGRWVMLWLFRMVWCASCVSCVCYVCLCVWSDLGCGCHLW
jgi:hypothetical protein